MSAEQHESDQAAVDEELEPLAIGDHVVDCEVSDSSPMLVVGLPLQQAANYEIATDGKTIADVNPDYPETDLVIEVAYPERTDVSVDEKKSYGFPRSRLELERSVHRDVDPIVDVLETMARRALALDDDPNGGPDSFEHALRHLVSSDHVDQMDEAFELAEAERTIGGDSR